MLIPFCAELNALFDVLVRLNFQISDLNINTKISGGKYVKKGCVFYLDWFQNVPSPHFGADFNKTLYADGTANFITVYRFSHKSADNFGC